MKKKDKAHEELVDAMMSQMSQMASREELSSALELTKDNPQLAIQLILACQACGITVNPDFVKLLQIIAQA